MQAGKEKSKIRKDRNRDENYDRQQTDIDRQQTDTSRQVGMHMEEDTGKEDDRQRPGSHQYLVSMQVNKVQMIK
jgi:hypothetical protein